MLLEPLACPPVALAQAVAQRQDLQNDLRGAHRFSPRILAFLVPLLPPAPHLLDLTLLGAHDVPCEPLYAWVLTLLVGHSAISLADRW